VNTAITLKKNTMLEILNVPAVKAWYRVLKEIQFMKFARKLSCTMPASELIISISTLTMNVTIAETTWLTVMEEMNTPMESIAAP